MHSSAKLSCFFDKEMRDTKNRPAVRRKAEDLHGRLEDPLFALYLFFLQPILDILADINRQLQKANQSLYVTYCKIKAFKTTLLEPLLKDCEAETADSNLRLVEETVARCYGSDFQQHLLQCKEHDLLTEKQLSDAKKAMYTYFIAISNSLNARFPELDFMTTNLSFIDPSQRKLYHCNMAVVIDKFDNGEGVHFCKTTVTKQYRNYCNDTTLDFLYEVSSNSDPVLFFIKLYNDEEYSELARLALLIYALSPDSVACERGFSSMNYVKNQHRTRLNQDKLNACMAIAMETRTVETFPFVKL